MLGRRAAWLAAVPSVVLAGCTGSTADERADAHADHVEPGPAVTIGEPDVGFLGPQGRVAQFIVECPVSHTNDDDPIVFPGERGRSHSHEFFGNTTTDAMSTLASLQQGDTTCDQRLDRAAYWVPALFDGPDRVVPEKLTAYYRPGPGVDPTSLQPFPAGLELLAGDPTATVAQPLERVAWTCGTGAERSASPLDCPVDRGLRLLVTFPDCWDGMRLDHPDHRSHAAYSHGGRCGETHPVPLPQLTVAVSFTTTAGPHDYELASHGVFSGHADFFNAWDDAKLASEIELCLHRGLVCGVTSGRKSG